MKKRYLLCNKRICIDAEYFPGDNPVWSLFETDGAKADINISCRLCDEIPQIPEGNVRRAGEVFVSVSGGNVYRSFPMGRLPGALTVYSPADVSSSITYFTPRSFPIMADDRFFWSSVSLAQLMLGMNAFFLHSSFISIGGKAVLFSAPSGTGKSTQAALWKKSRNAETINGDKAGILVENGIYACGVPFCGTSGICKNRVLPLGAIVFISQSPYNRIGRCGGVDALQKIMQNTYLDFIAPDEQRRFVDAAIEIINTVPVYDFGCTPDENAVITLENTLKSEGVI